MFFNVYKNNKQMTTNEQKEKARLLVKHFKFLQTRKDVENFVDAIILEDVNS